MPVTDARDPEHRYKSGRIVLAIQSMFCRTDDSTLPSSSLASDTDSCSCQSFSSSTEEHLDHSLDFLTHSWPSSKDKTTDHLGHQFSSFASWNDLNTVWSHSNLRVRPETSTSWKGQESRTFGTRSDQTSERGCSQDSGTPRKRPSSCAPLTKPDREAPARGCSPDASTLYNNSSKHYNPSVSGQHACQEISDYREWANCYLQYSTDSAAISDLPRDLADGRTLLHLVKELLGISMDPVHVKPALKVQKIENIQKCLDVLTTHCIPVQELSAEDIVEANPKAILVLCKHLKQHFGSTPGSPRGPSYAVTMNRPTPSPRAKHISKLPVMDTEDIALFDWVGQLTGRVVSDYNSLQDGHILCLLVNKLTDGAVPHVVLEYGLSSEKVSLALMFAEEELGAACDLNPDEVVNLKDASKLASFLKTLHGVFLQQVKEKEHDIAMQGISKLARKPRELTMKEQKMAIGLVRQPDTTPSSFAERVTARKSGKEGSIVPNNAHKMAARSPSRAKVKSKRNESQRRGNGLASYLQASVNKMPSRDNRLPNHFTQDEYSHFPEDLLNPNSSYRNSLTSSRPYPFYSVDISLENSQHQAPPRRKQDVARDVLAKESIFDSANWTPGHHMQHAPKSWEKERENAQHQISDFKDELQRLKEEYFRLMNMKVLQTPDKADLLTTTANSFRPEELVSEDDTSSIDINNSDGNVCTVFAGKPVTQSGQTSSSIIAYINARKGTLPPYRTWSKYENTDGDRYRYYHAKKKASDTRNNTLATKMTHSSSRITVQSQDGTGSVNISSKCRARQADDAIQFNSECNDSSHVSSRKKVMQSDGLGGVVGKHLSGMTALARLSSKKANAVSDTDS